MATGSLTDSPGSLKNYQAIQAFKHTKHMAAFPRPAIPRADFQKPAMKKADSQLPACQDRKPIELINSYPTSKPNQLRGLLSE